MNKGNNKIESDNPNRMYSDFDRHEIEKLFKLSYINEGEANLIYKYIKKYIRPNAGMYSMNCNCATGISNYYDELTKWFLANSNKFDS